METKVELKVKIKGQCIIISVKQEFSIEKILDFLRSQKIILQNIRNQDFVIKNSINGQIISSTLIKVCNIMPADSKNMRCIEINWREESKSKYLVPTQQNVQYQYKTEDIFRQACEYSLAHDLEQLRELYKDRKISKELFELFHKISDNIVMKKETNSQIQPQNHKINDGNQIKSYQARIKQLQTINQQQLMIISKHEKQLSSINQLLQIVKDQSNPLQALSKKKVSIKQDMVNHLQRLCQNYQLKIKNHQIQMQKKYRSVQEILEMSSKSNQNLKYSLLIKSRTFQIQEFKKHIDQVSIKLKEHVERFSNNQIKQIKSEYFDLNGNNSIRDFMKEIKDKNNFILLFSTDTEIFGIFSSHAFARFKKSERGFLFNLIHPNILFTKAKQPLWKQSNHDIKIGDSILTMAPSVKGQKLKIKKSGKLSGSFDMAGLEDREILGTQSNVIQVNSFEFMTIIFQYPEMEETEIRQSMVNLKQESEI